MYYYYLYQLEDLEKEMEGWRVRVKNYFEVRTLRPVWLFYLYQLKGLQKEVKDWGVKVFFIRTLKQIWLFLESWLVAGIGGVSWGMGEWQIKRIYNMNSSFYLLQISDNISSWRVTIFKQLATIVWRCRVVAKFVTSTVYFYLYQLEGLSEMSPILLLLFWIPVPPTQGVEHLQEPLCSLKNTCPLLSYTI